jgi:hypothetical protein
MRWYFSKTSCDSKTIPLILFFIILEHLYLIQVRAIGFMTMGDLSKVIKLSRHILIYLVTLKDHRCHNE